MNRTSMRIAVGVAALIAAGACGFDAGTAGATVPDPSEPGIPDGMYRTPEVTYDQLVATAVAAGFTEADATAFLGPDSGDAGIVFSLRLAAGGWTQSVSFDGAADEVGWRGTYEVVDDDTVVAMDFCGAITYNFAVSGDVLTLDMVDDQCDDGGVEDLIAQTVIFETAPFTRVETAGTDPPADTPTSYASTTFVVPFEVTPPEWAIAEPTVVLPNFVTWESTTVDRGIRFLVPLNVYPPGSEEPTPPPDDYLAYLLGQSEQGAVFTDISETTVDDLPATIVTATTPASFDGSLGCQEDGIAAEECFGLQPDLILRMAVIDTGDQTLLVWVRDILGAAERDIEYDTFDAMLASLRFTDAVEPAPEATAAAIATPIDGT